MERMPEPAPAAGAGPLCNGRYIRRFEGRVRECGEPELESVEARMNPQPLIIFVTTLVILAAIAFDVQG